MTTKWVLRGLRVQRNSLPLVARHFNTNKRVMNTDKPSTDQSVESIQLSFNPEWLDGRKTSADNAQIDACVDVLGLLEKPQMSNLLPLKMNLVELHEPEPRTVEESSNPEGPSRGIVGEVLDGFKLIYALASRKIRMTWVKNPQQQQRQQQQVPVEIVDDRSLIDKGLAIKDWELFTDDMEVAVTRVHNLQPGEKLVIIGGGISGLSTAWFIARSRPDIKIELVEASDRFGGCMNSETVKFNDEETVFEYGPRTLLPRNPGTLIAAQMISELGLSHKLRGISKRAPVNAKAVVFDDKLLQFPTSLWETIRFTFSSFVSGFRLALFKEFLVSKPRNPAIDDESVESFISRRFNPTIANRLVSALMRGIYGGDIAELSARSVTALNRLYTAERTEGASAIGAMFTGVVTAMDDYTNRAIPLMSASLIGKQFYKSDNPIKKSASSVLLDGGIQQFALKIAQDLETKDNVSLHKNSAVTNIRKVDGGCEVLTGNGILISGNVVISTVPGYNISNTLTASPKAQELTKEFKFATLAVVDFFFPKKQVGKNWFGFLIPKTELKANDVLGVIFDSAVRNSAVPLDKILMNPQSSVQSEDQNAEISTTNSRFNVDSARAFLVDQFGAYKSKNIESSPTSLSESTTLTVMMGGHLWDGKPLPSEKEVIDNAVESLKKYLEADFTSGDYIVEMKFAKIPQYTVGHAKRVNELHEVISQDYDSRLYLSGTTFGRGVAVGDCLIDAVRVASRFSERRKLLYPQYYVNNYMAVTYPDMYA